MISVLLRILNYVGAITIYILGLQFATNIIDTIEFRFDGVEYILNFGVGIVLYYPCNYILNKHK